MGKPGMKNDAKKGQQDSSFRQCRKCFAIATKKAALCPECLINQTAELGADIDTLDPFPGKAIDRARLVDLRSATLTSK